MNLLIKWGQTPLGKISRTSTVLIIFYLFFGLCIIIQCFVSREIYFRMRLDSHIDSDARKTAISYFMMGKKFYYVKPSDNCKERNGIPLKIYPYYTIEKPLLCKIFFIDVNYCDDEFIAAFNQEMKMLIEKKRCAMQK
jgi:hypothetical protein